MSSYVTQNLLPKQIITNTDFLIAVNSALDTLCDPSTDRISVNVIHSMLSSIKTKNAAILLSELGKYQNADPESLLKYMIWFASSCPIDSNVCT